MALIRWQPLNEFAALQSDINRLFSSFADSGGSRSAAGWVPPMDLLEREDHYLLRADLPGLSESEVQIEVEDRTLVISGERKVEHETQGESYFRLERASGPFSRSLLLPEGVEPENIAARFDNGVLEIEIPKPTQAAPRRIAIQGGNQQRQLEQQEAGS